MVIFLWKDGLYFNFLLTENVGGKTLKNFVPVMKCLK
ncbi:hypothetical protein ABID39_000376 [Bartonella japonica]|uniref:Uncharacterized protein n=1 Tax=Bartonella japonica TaxID=357761 RepID=A0ABV2FM97_9HYPH